MSDVGCDKFCEYLLDISINMDSMVSRDDAKFEFAFTKSTGGEEYFNEQYEMYLSKYAEYCSIQLQVEFDNAVDYAYYDQLEDQCEYHRAECLSRSYD